MRILWNEQKNKWLKKQRNISFEMICEKIENGDIFEVLENPSTKYPHQGVLYFQLTITLG